LSSEPRVEPEVRSQPVADAVWRTTVSKKVLWCRLSRADLDMIVNEALNFAAQSTELTAASIEWRMTWPGVRSAATPDANRRTRKAGLPDRIRREVRATEDVPEVRRAGRSSGLDAMVDLVAKQDGRTPHAIRHLQFELTVPGYSYFLRIGAPSRKSPRVMVRCTGPQPGIPAGFRTVAELLVRRSMQWTLGRVFLASALAWTLVVGISTAMATNFQSAVQQARHGNYSQAVVWGILCLACVWLVGVAFLSVTAARVAVSRTTLAELITESVLRPVNTTIAVWKSVGRDTKLIALIGLATLLVALLAWLVPF